MRQVVNSAKGGPLLGQSSCIMRSEEQQHVVKDYSEEEEMDDDEDDEDVSENNNNHRLQQQQRRRHGHSTTTTAPKPKGPRQQIERERRLRREIANSNERRRMQSINQGYMSLKRMLPIGESGEKLSKAAVLQNAADYMAQILEERKQLLIRNADLTQALNAQRHDEAHPARRKREMTESSDEGIGLSFPPDAEVIEDLRRTVTDLRIKLEQEIQRRTLIEQSYTYSIMAAQAVPQPALSGESIPTTVMATPLSPPHSRQSSTEEPMKEHANDDRLNYRCSEMYDQAAVVATTSAPSWRSSQEVQPMYGKASSVASQNLSIIVEAINHLEGDAHGRAPTSDKETDSGVSHGESSDESKSERSVSGTPQPPPAHQPSALLSAISQHRPTSASTSYTPTGLQQQGTYCTPPTAPAAAVPLLYRPTFLSNYISNQQSAASTKYIPSSQ